MNEAERTHILFLKHTYAESQKGHAYLQACQRDQRRAAEQPAFWTEMYTDSKLAEEACAPRQPRIGTAYQWPG